MTLARKVALVLDALPGIGGAEKVLMGAMRLFPNAPVYTLLYNRPAFRGTPIGSGQVHTSFIDRLPKVYAYYRKTLPLMPLAIGRFDLSEYDLILSFSYAVAHGVKTQPSQLHFSYTHTPMRYAWSDMGLNGEQTSGLRLWSRLFAPFRHWDFAAVASVDRLASVSRMIAGQVQECYRRESQVIYPPVAVERFTPQVERGDYFLTVSRLVAHKRVDLMVEAFNRLGLPLWVVGEGPERRRLESRAKGNIRFLGFQPDSVVTELFNRARAYLSGGKEDFGISMVEAQAAGSPVIAYQAGGALETVGAGRTGLFFSEPSAESLSAAVEEFEKCRKEFQPLQIAASVQHFNEARFLREFAAFAEEGAA